MPREWEQYIREREAAEGPEDDEPRHVYTCPAHGEIFDGGGFCGSCYVEEIQAAEKLAAENGFKGRMRRTEGRSRP
jgi:hypothetical protein